jgi:hypothetical protein
MRKLTGRFDFRRTLFGNQVLVVEEDVPNFWPMSRKKLFRRRWRRATPLDLATPELRGLMDLMRADRRSRPLRSARKQFGCRTLPGSPERAEEGTQDFRAGPAAMGGPHERFAGHEWGS